MEINTNEKQINELLSRGVDEVIDAKDLKEKLMSGKQLRIKLGIDPTSPNLHIGRSIPLLKLRDFQELGHKIVFLIGDFTGVIGDTSDKDSERPMLDAEVVKQNMAEYATQAGKIIDLDKCEIVHNSDWLSSLTYGQIMDQANIFSVNEFIARDNIRKRLDGGKRVSLREVFYPLMQGYDSVEIKADVEVGGTDQRFNLLAGRELQRHFKQEPQNIITNPLVEGLDGRKMSSSWGNTVNLTDEPREMFGKIMSLKDEFIIRYFELVTRVELDVITTYKKELADGANPRDYKLKLAYELVRFYHDEDAAKVEQEWFLNAFSAGKVPDDIEEIKINDEMTYFEVVKEYLGDKRSNSDIRRLFDQGAVSVSDEKISKYDEKHELKSGDVVRVGKKVWFRVK